MSLTKAIIKQHLLEGRFAPGRTVAVKIDQTLTQDATGTLAYLEFESLGLDRIKTEISVSYVDHNLLQSDPKNADDHAFLRSVAKRYGIYFSEPGNGICHQVHLERFATPGKTLLGSDSHTPMAGAVGSLAMGAGGLDVAAAMAGQPFYLTCPKVMGIRLNGHLPDWVAGKDVILELLSQLTVKGGIGWVIEYFGPGVDSLNMAHRATICHMGAELGATGSVFPSDHVTQKWLQAQNRAEDWVEMASDENDYDRIIDLDLSNLEPMMALSPSPDKVVKVSTMVGRPISQVIIGSSGNSCFHDLMLAATVLKGQTTHADVSFEINPGSRQVMTNLAASQGLADLIYSGARIHQPGCLGCIGMGQAPASGTISLRTFPRNFCGRSGTPDDQVHLVSAETAVASALTGVITDPRNINISYPKINQPEKMLLNESGLTQPLPKVEASRIEIVRGPHIAPFPQLDRLPDDLTAEVVIKVGDNITTDDIMPGGAKVLPWRSNISRIAEFAYSNLDAGFAARAQSAKMGVIVGGDNYGQGSSREHAALGPRYLGIRAKLAKSFARIHRANLINFGVVPLIFADPNDYDLLEQGESIELDGIRDQVANGGDTVKAIFKSRKIELKLDLSPRERSMILAGGLLNHIKTTA